MTKISSISKQFYMPYLRSFYGWLNSLPGLHEVSKPGNSQLESLNFKIRLTSCVLFLGCSIISPLITNFHLILHVLFPIASLVYLYLLLKNKTELLFGLPYIIIVLGLTFFALMEDDCYLCLLTSSLGILAIFSTQGYSPRLGLFVGLSLLSLQRYFAYRVNEVYEPITDSYRISAVSFENAVKGWMISLTLELFSFIIYQIIFKKMWSQYQETKQNLEELNRNLKETNFKLSRMIEDLEQINKELRQSLKSRELSLACVAHELRNPLNVLLNGIEHLGMEVNERGNTEIIKICKMCGEGILDQVNNLLDAAKINADKIEINNSPTKMSTFLDKFWALARIGLEKKGINGYLTVDKKLPLWLNIDSHRLHQVMDNIMGNALKFTTKGSIRVTIYWIPGLPKGWLEVAASQGKIEKSIEAGSSKVLLEFEEGDKTRIPPRVFDFSRKNNLEKFSDFISIKSTQSIQEILDDTFVDCSIPEDSYLRIDIVDTGCGITEDEQLNIFKPFEQANRSVSTKYGGTGLGLFIVKKLVEKMGGTIKLNSIQGVGTRFQVLIPIKGSYRRN